jgi:beta-glucosidase
VHRQSKGVTFDFFGANFYPWSYSELRKGSDDAHQYVTGDTSGDKIGVVLREAYKRYHMPIMVTETSANKTINHRARWMDETIDTVRQLRLEGMPVIGYTWFPLFTMIEWDYPPRKASNL